MQQYQLRVPIRLTHALAQPLVTVRNLNVPALQVSLETVSPYIVLTAKPFDSESAAKCYLERVWGALAWASASLDTGFNIDGTIRSPTMSDDPEQAGANLAACFGLKEVEPVDGLVDGNAPAVVPMGKRMRYVTGGDAKFTIGKSTEAFLKAVSDGLSAPSISEVALDPRLRTAIEILAQSHIETTTRARFVSLTSALEVLTEPSAKHQAATAMLDEFRQTVLAARDQSDDTSESWHALDDLQRDVLFRSEASIRSRVRRLARDAFRSQPDATELSKRAVWAYDKRSTLVHNGVLDDSELSEAFDIAKATLRQVLVTRIQRLAKMSDGLSVTKLDGA